MSETLAETERTRHRRLREQGSHERADLIEILRAGFVCHLGVIVDGDAGFDELTAFAASLR